MTISVRDIIRIDNANDYKLHLACQNEEGESPLSAYTTDYRQWLGWNEWKKKNRNDWTREYVFSLIEFYPKVDSWLFGGIFRVIERAEDRYKLERIESYEKFEGRLLLSFHRYQGMRGRAFYLETYIDKFTVKEILPERYSGEPFCGYENINHDFGALEIIFKNERDDWKSPLSKIKGVYVISDNSNGKLYVGSAYGNIGIWSRWGEYLADGHGGDVELKKIIDNEGLEHARKYFKFSLLEIMPMTVFDDSIIKREEFWKRVLLSGGHGYNRN